jgi:multidrug efflux pump subunit AcrA (membrane-fusion protein)
VVANLGITFAKAKTGRIETRLAVPGRVEVAPEARFAVRAPAAGRVLVMASRWQRVARGDVVAELLTDDLRAAQQALFDAEAGVARADLDVLRARAESEPAAALAEATEASLASARERVTATEEALRAARELQAAAAARVETVRGLSEAKGLAESALFAARKDAVEAQAAALDALQRRDDARAAVPELAREAGLARAKAAGARREVEIVERRRLALEAAVRQQTKALAALTGTTPTDLAKDVAGRPVWLTLESLALRAPAAGVVVEVPVGDGEWVESSATVVRIVDPTRAIFRGEVPEGDAGRIPKEAAVRVDVGCAGCAGVDAAISAPLAVADPRTRTVLVEARIPGDGSRFPDGASAVGAVLLGRSASEEVLVPAECVVRDELETLVFRRDPAKPDQVIRTPVSVGRRAEGWVEVLSEVGEGDEVVRDGVHQLRLTGIGKAPANGHFHADGTWHEGKD